MDLLAGEEKSSDFFDNLINKNSNRDFGDNMQGGIPKEDIERSQKSQEKLQRRDERRERLKTLWSEKLFGGKKDENN